MPVITSSDISTLSTGINDTFAPLESALNAAVWAQKLPIVSTFTSIIAGAPASGLSAAEQALLELRELKKTITTQLNNLASGGDQTEGNVESTLNSYLSTYNITADLDLSDLSDIKLTFTTGTAKSYEFTHSLSSDFGLPSALGLAVQTSGTADVDLTYDLDFQVGLDTGGFYLRTSDSNELKLSLDAAIPGFTATANLGFLHFNANDIGATPSTFTSDINVDFIDSNNDGKLRAGELTGDVLNATLTGAADINLHLASDMGTAVLPSVSADLNIDWGFSNSVTDGDPQSFGNTPTIAFNNVEVDLGTFATDYVLPILNALDAILRPIGEVTDLLKTRISFLEGLEGATGLLDTVDVDVDGDNSVSMSLGQDGQIHFIDLLVKAIPSLNFAPILQFINTSSDILEWIDALAGTDYSGAYYDLGGFNLSGTDIRIPTVSLANANPTLQGVQENLEDFVDDLSAIPGLQTFLRDLLPEANGEPASGNALAFPILDRANLFKVLLGGNADLFTMDLAPITLGYGSLAHPQQIASIPVFPFINLNLEFFANVTVDTAFGFDTTGLQAWKTTGYDPNQIGKVFQGFYVSDQVVGGNDQPEVTFEIGANLIAELDAIVASVGVGGGISANVFLNLKDPNFDGKVYYNELASMISNPRTMFNTSGRVTAGLTAYVTALGLFEWRYNSPRAVLLQFSFDDSGSTPPTPPGFGTVDGDGVLILHMGSNASFRTQPNQTDGAETFEVNGNGSIAVSAFGLQQVFTGVTQIYADAGENDDQVILGPEVTVPADLSGGAGSDYLSGGSGSDTLHGNSGSDFLQGMGGADSLYGDTGDDILEGGGGADYMDGGDGYDVVTYVNSADAVLLNLGSAGDGGDAAGDNFANIEAYQGSSHGDNITGSPGNDNLFGYKGGDLINGAGGDDVISGDEGSDNLSGGEGYDRVSYELSSVAVNVNLSTERATSGSDTDTLSGFEQVSGSRYNDTLIGGDLNDVFVGGRGNVVSPGDSIDGGGGIDSSSYITSTGAVTVNLTTGNNTGGDAQGDTLTNIEQVEGSRYNDNITGDDQSNYLLGQDGNDVLSGMGNADSLYGGQGNDTMYGGDGNDTFIPGPGADSHDGGAGSDLVSYFNPSRTNAVNISLTGSPGSGDVDAVGDTFTNVENVEGTDLDSAGDTITGNASANIISTFRGADSATGGAGNDILHGGAGADTLRGEGDQDQLFGSDGNDELDGGAGDDTLVGNAGADSLIGGSGIDWADYSSSSGAVQINLLAERGAGGDAQDGVLQETLTGIENVQGSTLGDIIQGDAFANYFNGLTGDDLLAGLEGNDTIWSHEGSDTIFGDAGDDVLNGGADNDSISGGADNDAISATGGNDTVQGNSGNDTLFGGSGADNIQGNADDDLVYGMAGADTMDGGSGNDTLSYANSDSGVIVNLLAGNGFEGDAAGDVISLQASLVSTFEALEGSNFDDQLIGDIQANLITAFSGADIVDGAGGDDTILAGDVRADTTQSGVAGGDTLYGGDGTDLLSYANATTGVIVSLFDGVGTGGDAAGDVIQTISGGISQFENLKGSSYSDTLEGDSNGNVVDGGNGSDLLKGRGGDDTLNGNSDDDTLDGGAGADLMSGGSGADYYIVDHLDDAVVEFPSSGNDTIQTVFTTTLLNPDEEIPDDNQHLLNVENIYLSGTGNIDATGDVSNNKLYGNAGNNVLIGRGGSDTISGFGGDDSIDGGTGNDTSADVLDGGSGIDLLDYSGSSQAVYVNLADQTVDTRAGINDTNKGAAYGDQITGFEGALGSAHSDSLIGSEADNLLSAWTGFDTVAGAGGTDVLRIDYHLTDPRYGVSYDSWDAVTGNGRLRAGDYYNNTMLSVDFTGIERFDLTGTPAGDLLRGNVGNDTLKGWAGDDELCSEGGTDTIIGGAGNDRLTNGLWGNHTEPENLILNNTGKTVNASGDVSANADPSALTQSGDTLIRFDDGTRIESVEEFRGLILGSGNDLVALSGYFHDSATLGGGSDTINVGLGYDTVEGGANTDLLVFDYHLTEPRYGVSYDSWNGGTGSGRLRMGDYYNNTNYSVDFSHFERFNLTGSPADDTLRGLVGNDTLKGWDGNDVLFGEGGVDSIVGGAGNDRLTNGDWSSLNNGIDFNNSGLPVNVSGDILDANATVFYSPGKKTGSEVLVEFNGVRIEGVEEFQSLSLGSAADIVAFTGYFHDSVNLGDGDDTINTGLGFDTVEAAAGVDLLTVDYHLTDVRYGVSYDSWDASGNGRFRMGDYYNNTIYSVNFGNFERFNLIGSPVGDALRGLSGNDTLKGWTGDDTLFGEGGIDSIVGGAGNDRLTNGNWAPISDAIDFNNTGLPVSASGDVLAPDATVFASPGEKTLAGDVLVTFNGNTIESTEEFQNLTLGSGSDLVAFAGYFHDSVNLGAGDDTINVGLGFDTMGGAAGRDVLVVDYTPVDVRYGVSYDTWTPGSGSGRLRMGDYYNNTVYSIDFADFERFNLTGSPVDDLLRGLGDNDTLKGGAGNDNLVSEGGNDSILGGAGNDRLTNGLWSSRTDSINFNNSGGADAEYTDATHPALVGASGGPLVTFGTISIERVEEFQNLALGSGNDLVVFTGYFHDSVNLGAGNDTIKAGIGHDTLDGADGEDILAVNYSGEAPRFGVSYDSGAGTGTGVLRIGDYYNNTMDRVVFSNFERFNLTGTPAADTLHGMGSADTLIGGDGDDSINSGGGADSINGGANVDTVYNADWSALAVTDFNNTDGVVTLAGVRIDNVESFRDVTLGGGASNVVLTGYYHDVMNLGAGNDTINVGMGHDVADGGADTDVLVLNYFTDDGRFGISYEAGAGSNTGVLRTGDYYNNTINRVDFRNFERFNLTGTERDDTLYGLGGNDTLIGGSGNDSLNSGGGIDFIDGGAGVDTVWNANWSGHEDNLNFDNLAGGITFADGTHIEHVEAFRDITLGGGNDTVVLDGYYHDSIALGAGDDSINAGVGIDTLDGGPGTDVLTVDYTSFNDRYEISYPTWDGLGNGSLRTGDYYNNTVYSITFTNFERFKLTGTIRNDDLRGIGGNDTLDGAGGNDTLTGGGGNDTYTVGSTEDVVIEAADGGDDQVSSTATWTISANVESLFLKGTADINGYGNDDNNTIVGNPGSNTLEGRGGNDLLDGGDGTDSLVGGLGDDTFYVDRLADSVVENAEEGFDVVNAGIDYTLGSHLEGLVLTGTAQSGTGNSLNNTLTGNDAANRLDGGAGDDTMIGGLGNDTYVADSSGDVVTETSTLTSEIDLVESGVTYTLGTNVENLTLTGVASINGTGNTAANQIAGNSAVNTLDGKAGSDTMTGGDGNDTYVVDSSGDVVSETNSNAAQIDTVQSSITFSLGQNVEYLTLTGAAAINATGNSSNNQLTGNSAANVLNGGSGVDTLIGNAGNDTYVVDSTADIISETSTVPTEIDTVQANVTRTLEANIENLTFVGNFVVNGTGNSLPNNITGNGTANVLDGKAGNDTLTGGAGNDKYVVDSTGDVISETTTTASEIDTVESSVTWTLGANLEQLTLTGSAAINGTGNTLNNTITGNGGANKLDGKTGNDTLIGNAGNDTYVVDSTLDVVTEASTVPTEIDLVESGVTFTLGANLEKLTLTGSAAINGTGNTLNNTITGNGGANKLDGKTGNDTLIGAAGNDTYVVDSTLDVITESSTVTTEIDLVQSSVTWTLGANLEKLTLTSSAAISGNGNTLANTLTGNAGVNTLDGKTGKDTLVGMGGGDTYVVDNTADVITETYDTAIDTVSSSVTRTLEANLENLTLTGSTAIHGTGNGRANTISGNSAANSLSGGLLNDTLTGAGGNDTLTGGDVTARGKGEIDKLTGGGNTDMFILGNSSGRFYDDGAASNAGKADYALITDFVVGEDRVQLKGTAANYYLGNSPVTGVSGKAVFFENGATDELIAIIQSGNSTTINAANLVTPAKFV